MKTESFINFSLPDGYTKTPWSFGFNVLSCGKQYTSFHCDWEDPADAFITLHVTSKKLWIFLSPGKLASAFERLSGTLESLLMLLPELKTSCVQGLQLPGDTIYLPFGCYHCVLTPAQDNQWTSLLSVSTFISPQQQEKTWKAIIQGRVQQRRQTLRVEGPVASLLVSCKI